MAQVPINCPIRASPSKDHRGIAYGFLIITLSMNVLLQCTH